MASSDSDDGVKVKEEPPSTTSDSAASREPSVVARSSRPRSSAEPAFDASIRRSAVPATGRDVQQPSAPLATEPTSAGAALNHIQFETSATSPGQTAHSQSTLSDTDTSTAPDEGMLRELVVNIQQSVRALDAYLSRSYGSNHALANTTAARAWYAVRNEQVITQAAAPSRHTPAASSHRDRSASPASRGSQYRTRTPPRAAASRRRHACQHCGRYHAGECWTCSRCNERGHTANTCTNSGRANAAPTSTTIADDDIREFLLSYTQANTALYQAIRTLLSPQDLVANAGRANATSAPASITASRDQVHQFLEAYFHTTDIINAAFSTWFVPQGPGA